MHEAPGDNELRRSLWDYIYGLLEQDEAEALRRRITSEPEVARLYASLKLESQWVAAAAAPNITPTAPFLNDESGYVSRYETQRAKRRKLIGGGVLVGGALAVALLLLISTLQVYWSPDSPVRPEAIQLAHNELLDRFPRLLVTGPTVLERGAPSHFEVIVQRLDGEPADTAVTAELHDLVGKKVWSQRMQTADGRSLRLETPRELPESAYRLVVKTVEEQRAREERIGAVCSTWLAVRDPEPVRYVTTDRLSYRRGDVAYFREVTLADASTAASGKAAMVAEVLNRSLSRDKSKMSSDDVTPIASGDDGSADWASVRWGELKMPADEQLASSASASLALSQPADVHLHDALESDLAADGANDADKETPEFLIESIVSGGRSLGQRFLSTHHGRSEDMQRSGEGSRWEGSNGDRRRIVYDYSVAPPRVLRTITPVSSTVRSLHVSVRPEAKRYAPGDEVRLELQVADELNQPAQAVLGVRLETFDPQRDVAPPSTLEYVSSLDRSSRQLGDVAKPSEPTPPLVFDNAMDQRKRFEQAYRDGRLKRNMLRQDQALLLLFGGSGGYFLLLFAALFKWTPRLVIWLPIAAALSLTFVVGVVWLAGGKADSIALPRTGMFTYGVQSTPPPPEPERRGNEPIPLDRFAAAEEFAAEKRFAEKAEKQEEKSGALAGGFKDAATLKESEFASGNSPFPIVARAETKPAEPDADGIVKLEALKLAMTTRSARERDKAREAVPGAPPSDAPLPAAAAKKANGFGSSGAPKQPAAEPSTATPALAEAPAKPQAAAAELAKNSLEKQPHALRKSSDLADAGRRSFSANQSGEGMGGGAGMSASASPQHDGPRTLYWHPYIVTDAQGKATVQFQLPVTTSAVRVIVDANTRDRLGSAVSVLPTQTPRPQWNDAFAPLPGATGE